MKNNHGGKREGSGRKRKEPSISLQFRVPKSRAVELKAAIKLLIKNDSKLLFHSDNSKSIFLLCIRNNPSKDFSFIPHYISLLWGINAAECRKR